MRDIEIRNFFSLAKTKIDLIEEVRKYFGKETSPRFNSFDFWDINENKVSQILAFFLDPNQNHEQGDIYLKHFIKKFGLDSFAYKEGNKVNVECEHRTGNGRRIDIVIYNEASKSAIGIENKIHLNTPDQKGQLNHYRDYLYSRTNGEYCLIYLSPHGKTISEDSISAEDKERLESINKLKCLSYEKDLINCIAEFSLMTDSIRVRSFLKDFEKTLRQKYMGQKDLEAKQAVVDLINESNKNLEISFMVMQSLPDVIDHLKEVFESQILEIKDELDLEVELDEDDEVWIRPNNWKKYWITYMYHSKTIYYGITQRGDKPKINKRKFLAIESLLKDRLRVNLETSDWWPIYEYLGENIEINPEFWLTVKNGEAKRRVKEFVKLINDNFNTDEY